jgi:large subunit ribosomal protein L13e
MKQRLGFYSLMIGRGFTFEELKEAGIRRKEALSLGISVDHRRKNRSVEGMTENVLRLKEFREKMIVLPSTRKTNVVEAKIDNFDTLAYATLRRARHEAKTKGKRDAQAKLEAEEEANKKK